MNDVTISVIILGLLVIMAIISRTQDLILKSLKQIKEDRQIYAQKVGEMIDRDVDFVFHDRIVAMCKESNVLRERIESLTSFSTYFRHKNLSDDIAMLRKNAERLFTVVDNHYRNKEKS